MNAINAIDKGSYLEENKGGSLPHTLTLAQRFSAGSSFAHQGTSVLSGDILIVINCRPGAGVVVLATGIWWVQARDAA